MRNRFPSFRSSNSRSFGSTAATLGGGTLGGAPSASYSSRDNDTLADAGNAMTTASTGNASQFFDEMDEDEVVARIMQQVRMCESSARRSLRPRPREGLAYSLDARNGSVLVVSHNNECSNSGHNTNEVLQHSEKLAARRSSSMGGGRAPLSSSNLYSVDDARPIPSYEVEVNTDRVGSLMKTRVTHKQRQRPCDKDVRCSDKVEKEDSWMEEEDDAFAYLMSGTPQRRRRQQQRESRSSASNDRKVILGRLHRPSGAGAIGVARTMHAAAPPRYMSRPRTKTPGDDSEESFVEHYGLVQYESAEEAEEKKSDRNVSDEMASNRASTASQKVSSTPRRTVREIRDATEDRASKKIPPPVRRTAHDKVLVMAESLSPSSRLNHSVSSSSSSSVSSPVPASPPADDSGGDNNTTSKAIDGDVAKPSRSHVETKEATVPRVLYEEESDNSNPATVSASSIMCTSFSWLGGGGEEVKRKPQSVEVKSPEDQRVAVERVAAQPHSSERTASIKERTTSGVDAPGTSDGASPPSAPATTTLYERLSRPVLCPAAAASHVSCTTVAIPREESGGDISSRTTARDNEDEIDVDVMRPWLGMAATADCSSGTKRNARTRTDRSSSSSHASTPVRVLRTIREAGSQNGTEAGSGDCNLEDDCASSMVCSDDEDLRSKQNHQPYRQRRQSFGSGPRRRLGSHQGKKRPPRWARSVESAASSTVTSLSRRNDDISSEATTLYDADETTSRTSSRLARSSHMGGRRGGVGCMALMEGMLTGIDRAERALLGNLTFDEDLWDDLHEDDYDLYSTEMTATYGDDDASSSWATRTTEASRTLTARRSGLTTLEDGMSAVASVQSDANDSCSAPAPRRSPRRGQHFYNNYFY